MGPKQEKKSEEKVKSAGIVTVRTTRETKPYTVKQALNTRTGKMLPSEVALSKCNMYNIQHQITKRSCLLFVVKGFVSSIVNLILCCTVKGILNADNCTFKDLEKGSTMLIGDAVQHKLVIVEYDNSLQRK